MKVVIDPIVPFVRARLSWFVAWLCAGLCRHGRQVARRQGAGPYGPAMLVCSRMSRPRWRAWFVAAVPGHDGERFPVVCEIYVVTSSYFTVPYLFRRAIPSSPAFPKLMRRRWHGRN